MSQLKICHFSGETFKDFEVLCFSMSAKTTQLLSRCEISKLRYNTTHTKRISANVSFYKKKKKMPNFELCHSCPKWAICNLCPEHGSSTLLRESSIRLPDSTACQKTTTDICNAVSFPDFTYKILFCDGFGWNQNFWRLAVDSASLMLRVDVNI
jgi:hypothetical protein